MTPAHVGVSPAFGRLIAEISPSIDHLLGRASTNAELQPSAGDQIGRTRVLDHIKWVLVAHVDDRRADFDAAGLHTDSSQQRKWRGKLAGEVMDAKIGPVRAQFLCRDGELDGLHERIRGRAGLRLRRRRPVPEREKADLLHAGNLFISKLVCDPKGNSWRILLKKKRTFAKTTTQAKCQVWTESRQQRGNALRTGCKQIPSTGEAFELICSPFVEFQCGPRYEVRDYAGYEDFFGPGICHYPGRRVDCDATDIAAPDLDFSGMQTRTQRQANLFGRGR